jgi:hypothetical protein
MTFGLFLGRSTAAEAVGVKACGVLILPHTARTVTPAGKRHGQRVSHLTWTMANWLPGATAGDECHIAADAMRGSREGKWETPKPDQRVSRRARRLDLVGRSNVKQDVHFRRSPFNGCNQL